MNEIDEPVGIEKTKIGGDAQKTGEFHGNPPGHAVTLDNQALLFQGRGQGVPQAFRKGPGKPFQAVSVEKPERHGSAGGSESSISGFFRVFN